MKIKTAEFIKSAVKPAHYPPEELSEIAFAGRSNVGKSSLINTLVNRKRLVKTSSTPGRTQLINFFNINDAVVFVDLPGYGYAKVPKRIQREWGPMIETYLTNRTTLKGVVLLLDIRRNPGAEEKELVDWFNHYGINAILVLTKADKFKRSKQNLQRERIAEELAIASDRLLLFSSKSRQGRERLLQAIETLIEPPVPVEIGEDR